LIKAWLYYFQLVVL